jgi:myo-inositol-1(or 4)-monophosphatase
MDKSVNKLDKIMNLQALCQTAIEAAHRAGAIIDAYRDKDVTVERKAGDGSEAAQVVTKVDREAQQAIVATLAPTLDQYDLALLAEESNDDGKRLEKAAFWCIDPMDGTLAFVRRVAGFSVSIALVARDGTPLIGVVYDPINKDTFHAIKGSGALRNGQPIIPPQLDPGLPLVLCTDPSFEAHPRRADTEHGLAGIATSLGLAGAKIDYQIGAVLNALCVLSKPNRCYFKYARDDNKGGSLWDYAATACLFNEVGAFACDMRRKPLDLNRAESTYMNHRGIVYSTSAVLARQIIEMSSNL